uniref:NADH-ubiquinone oxidoreductase chain 6 n=1 Tax=Protohermes concolorus TaxID=508445 RepID=B6RZV2_9NEOP|nr:NADH dehydrogenase subunit 6 [Protohermes concolorus]ACA51954.1 NADH dehydrogenase subunit 6 [Protohermes concolorus]UFZ12953.1 NADH dehydrogenase subunit 6 [Protohermes concolorus]
MMQLIILINFIITWNFTQVNHPLAMGMILLLQTILICLTSGMLVQTFWFSYILFLIMLGGMLILFIYMTSLASNELFSISMKTMIINLIMLSFFLLIFFMDSFSWITNMLNLDMTMLKNSLTFTENSSELLKLYNFPTMNLTLLLINYLFLTLIIIVKMTNIFIGPLRQFN